MTGRYSLRFDKGERDGRIVPVSAPRFTIGRRPDNALAIPDGSVSGAHAELVVDESGVTLRDLGSTNGTQVGGVRVTETRLAHGDRLVLGNVALVFQDAELAGEPAAESRPEEVERVSAETLARSGKRSRVGAIVVVVLVLAGAGAAALFLTGGQRRKGGRLTPVVPVEGNLLGGYSFEGDASGLSWEAEETAPDEFRRWGDARATGEEGMRATLDASEWAVLHSEPVQAPPGRTLLLGAKLRGRGGASGRVGIEFLDDPAASEPRRGAVRAWSDWIAEVTRHQELELSVPVPPGARRARVVVEARAGEAEGGVVDVDDVSLVRASAAARPTGQIGEYGLWLLGEPAQAAALYKVSTLMVSDLAGRGPDPRRTVPLALEPREREFGLRAAGASSLTLRVEPAAWTEGLATLGDGGLQTHTTDFEREAVTGLLAGEGRDLILLAFDAPVTLTGRNEEGRVRITAPLAGADFRLQVDFSEELVQAGNLAYAARLQENEGKLGECIASWNALLSGYPFDVALVREALEARGRLTQKGLQELRAVEERFERARFFRLVDLYRRCRADALVVRDRYAGSEVEASAVGLIGEIDTALASLEQDLNEDEIARLQSILRVLEATEAPRLAGEVRGYLREEYGVSN